MSLLASVLTHPLVEAGVRIGGLSVLAGFVTALAAFVFRAKLRVSLPEGAALILGLGAVAIYLNTRLIFVQFVGDTGDPLEASEAFLNVAVFVAAGIACYGGRYAGDRAGTSDRFNWTTFQPDLSPLVRATGRSVTVTLPADVADIDGYDDVPAETKAKLAGKTMDFPRGITIAALESQLTSRLKDEHDIGYVDVDIDVDGTISYLAVGKRAAGIGPTVPPEYVAIAVRADPPFSASPGDTVQLWRTDAVDDPERVGTGELRATVGDVATLILNESTAATVDPAGSYRLMTLAPESHPDREFATMLRRDEKTMSIIECTASSPYVGQSIRALEVAVIAIQAGDGSLESIPTDDRTIRAGDRLYTIGQPDTLRKIESTAGTRLLEERSTGTVVEQTSASSSQ